MVSQNLKGTLEVLRWVCRHFLRLGTNSLPVATTVFSPQMSLVGKAGLNGATRSLSIPVLKVGYEAIEGLQNCIKASLSK